MSLLSLIRLFCNHSSDLLLNFLHLSHCIRYNSLQIYGKYSTIICESKYLEVYLTCQASLNYVDLCLKISLLPLKTEKLTRTFIVPSLIKYLCLNHILSLSRFDVLTDIK